MASSVSPFRLGLVATFALALLHCQQRPSPEQSAQPLSAPPPAEVKPKPAPVVAPLDVGRAYPIVESIGANRRFHLDKTTAAEAHSPPEAWKIEFESRGGFGGFCWKNKAGNEGELAGDNLSAGGYRRIGFWARGLKGGEVAEFRAGGLGNIKTRHRDSFDVSAGKIRLGTSWKEYSIFVKDKDLSSVMTPFCVLMYREDNAQDAVVYVDDIEYKG
ncbi:MAG: hypothetical protein RL685_1967 [Pseudomonadota bacterium]|jgi:hypothetical protein